MQSKGLSRVFSNTTVQKHQFLALSFLHCPTLTFIHDHWKDTGLEPGKAKQLARGNLEKVPHVSDANHHKGVIF